MSYKKKPEMILFDVGGTLFDDTKCIPRDGLRQLRLSAKNPDVTDDDTLENLWNEYMSQIGSHKSQSGVSLDFLLSSVLKYVTMTAGLHFKISMAEQEEIFDRYNSERKVIDGVPELLDKIHSLGIRAAVISNNAMSGEGLKLAIDRWIPSNKMEFYLTSADILLTKPCKSIFLCASNYAGIKPENCWYCGDGRVPDVDGAKNAGMTPVLIDTKSSIPLEMRTDGERGEYMTVNNWNVLSAFLDKF
ncbi:MAG: HAD hydrolase-like protein [Clostridia bacterium]|nr:HAD hydrolase-like protein [Clostridia bacterium]